MPHEDGQRLTIYAVVKRTIDGATKRFIEYFEDNDPNLALRETDGVSWPRLTTDCSVTGTLSAGATEITGITHLPNTDVDVIIGDSFIGQKTVSAGGVITLATAEIPAADTFYEVGLHFDSTLATLRPAIPGEVTELLKRSWAIVGVRVENTIGGAINGKALKRPPDSTRMFTGLLKMENLETDDPYDGALTITQTDPYPMTVLGVSGKLVFAENQV